MKKRVQAFLNLVSPFRFVTCVATFCGTLDLVKRYCGGRVLLENIVLMKCIECKVVRKNERTPVFLSQELGYYIKKV